MSYVNHLRSIIEQHRSFRRSLQYEVVLTEEHLRHPISSTRIRGTNWEPFGRKILSPPAAIRRAWLCLWFMPIFQSSKIMVRNYSLDSSKIIVKMTDSDREQIQLSRDTQPIGSLTFSHHHEDGPMCQRWHRIQVSTFSRALCRWDPLDSSKAIRALCFHDTHTINLSTISYILQFASLWLIK